MENTPSRLELIDRTVDLDAREVCAPGATHTLTPTEVALLRFLASKPGVTIPRDELLGEVWGYRPGLKTRAVDYAVHRLRHKLEADPAQPVSLLSVHGVGYRLDLPREADIIGREPALRQIRERLDAGARWLTLIGPGGVGKTTLLAAITGPRAWPWVALANADDRSTALRAIARTLGFATDADDVTLSREVGIAISGRVIGLDNLEQLVSALRDDLARWVEGGARLLVTSRLAVEHPLEALVRVEPLEPDAAQRLFVRCLRDVAPDEAPSPEAIEALLTPLGGLPLAIELAAARARLLPLPALAARLDHGATVLRDPHQPERHSSLTRVFDDTWASLSAHARRALAFTASFVTPFEAAAAEAVLQPDDPDPLLTLDRLTQAGLLVRRPGPRFAPHALLRTDARARLSDVERAHADARHLAWWRRRVAQPDLPDDVVDELVVAFRRNAETQATEVATLLVEARHVLDRLLPTDAWTALLDRALAPAAPIDAMARATLLTCRGRNHRRAGQPQLARADLEAAVSLAATHGASHCLAEALHGRATLHAVCGQGDKAILDLHEARRVAREVGDVSGEALAATGEASTLLGLQRPQDAEAVLREAMATLHEPPLSAKALLASALGNACLHSGRPQEAAEWYQTGLALFAEHRDEGRAAVIRHNLALTRLAVGDLKGAEADLIEVIDAHRRAGRSRSRAIALGNLGRVRWLRGDAASAAQHLDEAARLLLHAGAGPRAAFYRLLEAMVEAVRGRVEAAHFALARAREDAAGHPLPAVPQRLAALCLLAATEEPEAAKRALTELEADPDPVLGPELAAVRAWLGGELWGRP